MAGVMEQRFSAASTQQKADGFSTKSVNDNFSRQHRESGAAFLF